MVFFSRSLHLDRRRDLRPNAPSVFSRNRERASLRCCNPKIRCVHRLGISKYKRCVVNVALGL